MCVWVAVLWVGEGVGDRGLDQGLGGGVKWC